MVVTRAEEWCVTRPARRRQWLCSLRVKGTAVTWAKFWTWNLNACSTSNGRRGLIGKAANAGSQRLRRRARVAVDVQRQPPHCIRDRTERIIALPERHYREQAVKLRDGNIPSHGRMRRRVLRDDRADEPRGEPLALNVFGGAARSLLTDADDGVLSGWLLQHRSGRRRQSHRVRSRNGRVSRVLEIARQRPLDACSGGRFSRTQG